MVSWFSILITGWYLVYRTGALNYALARRLVKISHVGLVNVLAGRELAPEFVQNRARPALIAEAVERLLNDERSRTETILAFRALRENLRGGRGAKRVAELAAELMGERST
jgi:lipid-A-disaccharide synthase